MATANRFKNASAFTPKADPKAKKSDKVEFTIDNLETMAAVDAVIKALTTLKDTYSTTIKDAMAGIFVTEGVKIGRRPDNFRGVEGGASASCELRVRSKTSPITDAAELALLEANNIETAQNESTAQLYVVNPAYMKDEKKLAQVSKALDKIPGLEDERGPFILEQERKATTIVTETSLNQIFKLGDAELTANLMKICGVLAIKPKLEDDDFASAMEVVRKAMETEEV